MQEIRRIYECPDLADALERSAGPCGKAGEPSGKGGRCLPGGWCEIYLCPVRPACRAMADSALFLEEFQARPPALLSPSELSNVLERGACLVSWYGIVKDHAQETLLNGGEIPGWKLVEGRPSREWADLETAIEVLPDRGVDAALLWERRPVTPPALEKVLGKKVFGELTEGLVVRRLGKPTLAPAGDKRPPYRPAVVHNPGT